MVTVRCLKCRFHGWLSGELCCDYMWFTGRSRTAQMTEADRDKPCRFFESGKRVPIKEKPVTDSNAGMPRFRFDQKKMRALYDDGLRDYQIALEMGCTADTVRSFRKRNKLPGWLERPDRYKEKPKEVST